MGSSPVIQLPDGCMGMPLEHIKPPCIAGIDTRYGSWDVICGDLLPSQHQVQLGRILRPIFAGKVLDEHQSLFLLRQYNVRFAVIDCRPEATLAIRLQEMADRYGIEVWRAEYNTNPGTIDITVNNGDQLYKLDRTITLDRVHHLFQTGIGVALPQNFREITQGKFASEMCSSTRVPFRWHGRDAWTWAKHGDDHTFHAFNLMLVAARMSGFDKGAAAGGAPELGIVENTIEQNIMNEFEDVYLEV